MSEHPPRGRRRDEACACACACVCVCVRQSCDKCAHVRVCVCVRRVGVCVPAAPAQRAQNRLLPSGRHGKGRPEGKPQRAPGGQASKSLRGALVQLRDGGALAKDVLDELVQTIGVDAVVAVVVVGRPVGSLIIMPAHGA